LSGVEPFVKSGIFAASPLMVNVLLAVTGSVAAIKAEEIVQELKREIEGAHVKVRAAEKCKKLQNFSLTCNLFSS
jgi:phosphopantothenoylcysteine synthetase/decarboxylase